MSGKDISIKIKRLKTIAFFGKHRFMNLGIDAFAEVFEEGENAVSFISVGNVNEFDSISRYLYNSNNSIVDNYTLRTFQSELAKLLGKLNKEDRDAQKNDWTEFINGLNDKPIIEAQILAPIHGVTMNQDRINLGEFIIYKSSNFYKTLKDDYPKIVEMKANAMDFGTEYVIGIKKKAKDISKCQELAEKELYCFENVANFVTGGLHGLKRVGIVNYLDSRKFVSIILSGDSINESKQTLNSFEKVQIDNPSYLDEQNGNSIIWTLITSKKNELQRKIVESIEWCGRAMVEPDDSKALLQYIISIESLLQFDEKKLINPSIVSRLSDMIGFLLGQNRKQRLDYVKYVIDLYGERSSISHGGLRNISYISLHTAMVLCHKIIRKFLTTETYNEFENKETFLK